MSRWQTELAKAHGYVPDDEGSKKRPRQGIPPQEATDVSTVILAVEHITGARGVAEHRFAPPRRWRFDAAWPDQKVALEVQGGRWIQGKGAHGRPDQAKKDEEKRQAAEDKGWRVLYCEPQEVRDLSVVVRITRVIDTR